MKIRQNMMGMEYHLDDHPHGTSISHGIDFIVVPEPIEMVSQRWYNWQMKGQYIQDAFNGWTPEQREFIMTGITPAQWAEMWGEE